MAIKRTIHGRIAETLLLVLAWPVSLLFVGIYLTCSITLDIVNKIITCWSES